MDRGVYRPAYGPLLTESLDENNNVNFRSCEAGGISRISDHLLTVPAGAIDITWPKVGKATPTITIDFSGTEI